MSTKVSFLVVTFGHQKYIADCIRSVFNQSYKGPIELVIGNDASPDETHEVIEQILKEKPKNIDVKYFNHTKNMGGVSNFNFCLFQCSGDLIFILDGDDTSDPSRVEESIRIYEKRNFSLLVTNAKEVDENGLQTGDLKYPSDFSLEGITLEDVYTSKTPIFGASYVMEKSVVDKYGRIDPVLVGNNNVDQIIFWRALNINGIQYSNLPLINYRISSSGASIQRKRNAAKEIGDTYQENVLTLKLSNNIICNLSYILITFPEGIKGRGKDHVVQKLRDELDKQRLLIDEMTIKDYRGLQYSNEFYHKIISQIITGNIDKIVDIRSDRLAEIVIYAAKNRKPTSVELFKLIEIIEKWKENQQGVDILHLMQEAQGIIKVPVTESSTLFEHYRNRRGKIDVNRLRKLQRASYIDQVFLDVAGIAPPRELAMQLSHLIKLKQIRKLDILFALAEMYIGISFYKELDTPFAHLVSRIVRHDAIRKVKNFCKSG